MLNQVVKGVRLPYNEHVLLERSVDVLRDILLKDKDEEPAELLSPDEPEPIVYSDELPTTEKSSKPSRRGGRRKK